MKPRHDGWTRCVSLAALVAMAWGLAAGVVLGETTGDVTWSGGAGSGNPYWNITNNWLGGEAPVTSTTATIYFKTNGQSVVGVLDADRQVGRIYLDDQLGANDAGQITHTLDLGGHTLTVAGNYDCQAYDKHTFAFTNGTVRFGTDSLQGNLYVGRNRTATDRVAPGATLDTHNLRDLRIGTTSWDNQNAILDLRGAALANGVLRATNIIVNAGAYAHGRIDMDGATSITSIQAAASLTIGKVWGPGSCYVGNPADSYRLPPGVSVRVGEDAGHRGTMTVVQVFQYGYGGVVGKLEASSGGTFTAFLDDLDVMLYSVANSQRGPNAHVGTLDISRMDACAIDTHGLRVAPDHLTEAPSSVDNLRGTMRLCTGTVTAGDVTVGATLGAGYGILALSNTAFTVTNSFTLNKTGQMTIRLGGEPKGLDVDGTFTDESTGTIAVHYLAAPTVATNWAIRIAGDAQSTLNAMIGDSRLTSTGTYPGKKVGVLYDGAHTYYAMADSNAFTTLPIAIAYDERTYEIQPGGSVTLGTNDIDNGSYDPDGRPLTLTLSTNGGPEGASVTFDELGDYVVTLTATAAADSATDTCTVHIVPVDAGTNGNLTWTGGASTELMDRREWLWSDNWLEGAPPTNPSTSTIQFRELGQAVNGRLGADRTIGGLDIGYNAATVSHTIDLGGRALTVAGPVQSWRSNVTVSNGTLRLGSDTEACDFHAASTAGGDMVLRARRHSRHPQRSPSRCSVRRLGRRGKRHPGSSAGDDRGRNAACREHGPGDQGLDLRAPARSGQLGHADPGGHWSAPHRLVLGRRKRVHR